MSLYVAVMEMADADAFVLGVFSDPDHARAAIMADVIAATAQWQTHRSLAEIAASIPLRDSEDPLICEMRLGHHDWRRYVIIPVTLDQVRLTE